MKEIHLLFIKASSHHQRLRLTPMVSVRHGRRSLIQAQAQSQQKDQSNGDKPQLVIHLRTALRILIVPWILSSEGGRPQAATDHSYDQYGFRYRWRALIYLLPRRTALRLVSSIAPRMGPRYVERRRATAAFAVECIRSSATCATARSCRSSKSSIAPVTQWSHPVEE
jgi:hypothetical protein